MDLNATLEKNNLKLSKSKVFTLMKEWNDLALKYPPAYIKYPSHKASVKREPAVMKAADTLFDIHGKFTNHFKDYQSSVILIQNEIAVSYMIEEAAKFAGIVDVFKQEIKTVNNVQELQQYYKQFTLKGKDILDALMSDLFYFSKEFNFEIEKPLIAEKFKMIKEKWESYEKFELTKKRN